MENSNLKYDPNLRYTWTKDDVFQLTGEEFGLVLNAFRGTLNTPEAARILLISEANKAIENIMAKGVEQGVVVEVIEEPTAPVPPLKVVK